VNAKLVLPLALAAAGCATTHALPHPPRMPAARAGCTIGVAPLPDEQGVDHALDLRDYLREHGPCKTVRAVTSQDDDTVDVVVAGKVTAQLNPGGTPGSTAAAGVLGAGLGALIGGAVGLTIVAKDPTPDANGFVSPSERNSQTMMRGLGKALIGAGAGVAAAGLAGLIVEGTVTRPISLSGRVDVDVTLLRKGAVAGQLHEHDEVTARGKHPSGRPEGRDLPAATGPLYREIMARVYEHIAARVADALDGERPSPGPP
jgi:hypothetical protein